jgi:hypothetical protein
MFGKYRSIVGDHTIKNGILATNIFKKLGGEWLMIQYHGSIVAKYVPPNISV